VFKHKRAGLLGLIYLIIGFIVAISHSYITLRLIRLLVSAILAIVLWFLVLLGINLHIH
jgi:hypothetical protein